MAKYKSNFQITSTEDNKTYWIAPTIVTVTAVFCISGNETYILASKRGKGMPNEQHKWNITAGYVDFKDKSMKESASREIYEEIGIKIDPNAIKFVEYKDPDESCANLSLRSTNCIFCIISRLKILSIDTFCDIINNKEFI